MAMQFANDTVEFAFIGDESDSNEFIGINNGWIKIDKNDADTHKYDTVSSTDYLNTVFPGLLSAMPNKYYSLYTQEDKSKIKIFCSPTVNRKYKQQLQARNTSVTSSCCRGHSQCLQSDSKRERPLPENLTAQHCQGRGQRRYTLAGRHSGKAGGTVKRAHQEGKQQAGLRCHR